jgi:hypothetical protein
VIAVAAALPSALLGLRARLAGTIGG